MRNVVCRNSAANPKSETRSEESASGKIPCGPKHETTSDTNLTHLLGKLLRGRKLIRRNVLNVPKVWLPVCGMAKRRAGA